MRWVIVGAGAGARWMGSVMTLSTIRLRRADAFGRGGGSDMVAVWWGRRGLGGTGRCIVIDQASLSFGSALKASIYVDSTYLSM